MLEPVVTWHACGPGRGTCPTCLYRALLAPVSSPMPPAQHSSTGQNCSSLPCPRSTRWQRGGCGSPLFILSPNQCSSCREPVMQVEIPNKFSPTVWDQLAISWECHNHMQPRHRGQWLIFTTLNPGTEFPTNPKSLSAPHQHISISFAQTDLLAKPPQSETNCLSNAGYEGLPLPRLFLKT